MYIEKKKIGKNSYNYLKASFRVGNQVKTRTIAYLGKSSMTKKEIEKKIAAIKENDNFLRPHQHEKLNVLKKDFSKKMKSIDKRLIEDMFKDFKTFYIYNTNAIEGNTITQNETSLLLNENKTPNGRDLREIYDHIKIITFSISFDIFIPLKIQLLRIILQLDTETVLFH